MRCYKWDFFIMNHMSIKIILCRDLHAYLTWHMSLVWQNYLQYSSSTGKLCFISSIPRIQKKTTLNLLLIKMCTCFRLINLIFNTCTSKTSSKNSQLMTLLYFYTSFTFFLNRLPYMYLGKLSMFISRINPSCLINK